ncbi:MAG TPA: VWA domain-containing protein [Pyrinomonadaceae bacterium]|nr:VWA domain-containing protein [Pyrinomonadaceae bacterium]
MRERSTLALPAALAFLFLFATATTTMVRAQEPQLPSDPPPVMPKPTPKPPKDEDYEVVRVTSNLVVVPVSVTDAAGQPVLGLKVPDFRLEEEGRAQEIAEIGNPEQVPLDIAVLLDVSSSVDARFTFEQQAAAGFLKQVLKPGDRATIFAIDEKPRFVQELTSAERASQMMMAVTPAKGFTAFYDTVLEASRYLEKSSGSGRRKVIVVISDGDDTARIVEVSATQNRNSDQKYIGKDAQLQLIERSVSEVQREVQRTEVTFYSINPSGQTMHLNVRTARSQQGMERIAEATGGTSFIPARLEDLPAMFNRIASELRSQYLLQYYSNNESAAGKFLRIKVALPAQPALRLRARQGYYSKGRKS